MTLKEMHELKYEYGKESLRINRAIHLHDEDEWNEYTISYKGIIVGSDLVPKGFVKENIERLRREGYRT